jgi:hypothetical protein
MWEPTWDVQSEGNFTHMFIVVGLIFAIPSKARNAPKMAAQRPYVFPLVPNLVSAKLAHHETHIFHVEHYFVGPTWPSKRRLDFAVAFGPMWGLLAVF